MKVPGQHWYLRPLRHQHAKKRTCPHCQRELVYLAGEDVWLLEDSWIRSQNLAADHAHACHPKPENFARGPWGRSEKTKLAPGWDH